MSSQRSASEGPVSAFANLPISRKLMAAFSAVVVVIFVSSAIVYDRLRVIEWAKNMRVEATDVLETLQAAMDAMVDQETGVRGYLINGDEKFSGIRLNDASHKSIAAPGTVQMTSSGDDVALDEIDGVAMGQFSDNPR